MHFMLTQGVQEELELVHCRTVPAMLPMQGPSLSMGQPLVHGPVTTGPVPGLDVLVAQAPAHAHSGKLTPCSSSNDLKTSGIHANAAAVIAAGGAGLVASANLASRLLQRKATSGLEDGLAPAGSKQGPKSDPFNPSTSNSVSDLHNTGFLPSGNIAHATGDRETTRRSLMSLQSLHARVVQAAAATSNQQPAHQPAHHHHYQNNRRNSLEAAAGSSNYSSRLPQVSEGNEDLRPARTSRSSRLPFFGHISSKLTKHSLLGPAAKVDSTAGTNSNAFRDPILGSSESFGLLAAQAVLEATPLSSHSSVLGALGMPGHGSNRRLSLEQPRRAAGSSSTERHTVSHGAGSTQTGHSNSLERIRFSSGFGPGLAKHVSLPVNLPDSHAADIQDVKQLVESKGAPTAQAAGQPAGQTAARALAERLLPPVGAPPVIPSQGKPADSRQQPKPQPSRHEPLAQQQAPQQLMQIGPDAKDASGSPPAGRVSGKGDSELLPRLLAGPSRGPSAPQGPSLEQMQQSGGSGSGAWRASAAGHTSYAGKGSFLRPQGMSQASGPIVRVSHATLSVDPGVTARDLAMAFMSTGTNSSGKGDSASLLKLPPSAALPDVHAAPSPGAPWTGTAGSTSQVARPVGGGACAAPAAAATAAAGLGLVASSSGTFRTNSGMGTGGFAGSRPQAVALATAAANSGPLGRLRPSLDIQGLPRLYSVTRAQAAAGSGAEVGSGTVPAELLSSIFGHPEDEEEGPSTFQGINLL